MYKLRSALNRRLKRLRLPRGMREAILKAGLPRTYQQPRDPLKKLEARSPFPAGTSLASRHLHQAQADLAVIVAAYNVEDYIAECVDSLLNQQTDYHYQVIVVDDGSTDHTMEILKKYQQQEPSLFKLIIQENGGISCARNRGLDAAAARYVTFVDADDYVAPLFVDELLRVADKTNADVVEGSYQTVSGGQVLKQFRHEEDEAANPFKALYGYPWGKIYRSTLFATVQFPANFWFEDTVAMYRVWPKARRVVTIPALVYNYRRNPASITHTSQGEVKTLDSLYITLQLLKDCADSNEQPAADLYDFTLSQMVMNFYRIIPLQQDDLANAFEVMAQTLDRYFPAEKFATADPNLKGIERDLRERNYKNFTAYCLTI